MVSSDETEEGTATSEQRIRLLFNDSAYSQFAAHVIAKYLRKASAKPKQQEIADVLEIGNNRQARISEWLAGVRVPSIVEKIIDKPANLERLLLRIGLPISVLWDEVTGDTKKTCLNPECPTIIAYVVEDRVIVRPAEFSEITDLRVCRWCGDRLESKCDCGEAIIRGSICECGLPFVTGHPKSLIGLRGIELIAACEQLNARNSFACGRIIGLKWFA